MDHPELIFEVEFKLPDLNVKIGSKNLFSIGKLIGQHGLMQEEERRFNINFPYKRNISHVITVSGVNPNNIDGLDGLIDKYETDDLSFTVDVDKSDAKIEITTQEQIKNNYIDVKKWPEIRAFYDAIKRFNESKIRF
jgi:hypothetical protein